eukprot:PhF_6_TR26705/c1_g3_i6/m.39016
MFREGTTQPSPIPCPGPPRNRDTSTTRSSTTSGRHSAYSGYRDRKRVRAIRLMVQEAHQSLFESDDHHVRDVVQAAAEMVVVEGVERAVQQVCALEGFPCHHYQTYTSKEEYSLSEIR